MKVKSNKRIKLSLVIILLCFFCFQLFFIEKTNAISSYEVTPIIETDVYPKYPGPNEDVSVKIGSRFFEIGKSFVSVYLNGELIDEGISLKNTSFKTRGLGSTDNLKIVADTNSKGVITKNIKISPSVVDIIWEADTYTPPFYKGKALQSPDSVVYIEAMPEIYKDGVLVDPDNLHYKWKQNSRVVREGFGVKGRSIEMENVKKTKAIEFKLEIESLDRKAKTSKYIKIPVGESEVVFYKKDPLMGINYQKSVSGDFQMEETEITLSACPYFFSIDEKGSSNIEYDWKINDKKQEATGDKKHTLTMRKAGEEGSVKISLFIRNIEKILQSAGVNLNINY